jgi:hypothetical protein
MASIYPTINDQITRLQLRLLTQQMENEWRRVRQLYDSDNDSPITDKYSRIEEAINRRQELRDKLERERKLNKELSRPSTYAGLPTLPRPRQSASRRFDANKRSESQPQLTDVPRQQKVDHRYVPRRSDRLNADDRAGTYNDRLPPATLPPIVQQQAHLFAPPQPPLQTNILHHVYEPVVAAPARHHDNSRAEMYEMLMIQNAQMHQMIMQQLMMATVTRPPQPSAVQQLPPAPAPPPQPETTKLQLTSTREQLSSIHHHQYVPAPAAVPDVTSPQHGAPSRGTGYTNLPPIQVRLADPQPFVMPADTPKQPPRAADSISHRSVLQGKHELHRRPSQPAATAHGENAAADPAAYPATAKHSEKAADDGDEATAASHGENAAADDTATAAEHNENAAADAAATAKHGENTAAVVGAAAAAAAAAEHGENAAADDDAGTTMRS